MIIQIFQQGRNDQQKQELFKALHVSLLEKCGLSGEDLIICCAQNTLADWSFGMGVAQFLTGQL